MAVLLLLVAQPAVAGTYVDKDGSRWNAVDPPERWFDEPAPATVNISKLPRETVISVCKLSTGKAGQIGCAQLFPWAGICDITVAEDLPARHLEAVIRHEEAHCRGWPADHPVE